MRNVATFVCVLLVAPCWSAAQTSTTANRSSPTPPDATATPPANAPRTERQRLHEYIKSWVSPISFLTCATGAGWGLLRDSPHEWGEGGEGFGLRFASAYGQHFVNSTILLTGASLLHEDNRYVPSGETTFRSRLKYALESSIVTRHDDSDGGTHRRVSFSRIAAFAGAAVISRAWQPPSTRGMNNAAVSFGASIAVTAGFNVVREFLHFK